MFILACQPFMEPPSHQSRRMILASPIRAGLIYSQRELTARGETRESLARVSEQTLRVEVRRWTSSRERSDQVQRQPPSATPTPVGSGASPLRVATVRHRHTHAHPVWPCPASWEAQQPRTRATWRRLKRANHRDPTQRASGRGGFGAASMMTATFHGPRVGETIPSASPSRSCTASDR